MNIDPDKVGVKEVMKTDLVVLKEGDAIEVAIDMFEDYGISGAPVIDESGRLCGVLTASDVLPLSPIDEPEAPVGQPQPGKSAESGEEAPAYVRGTTPVEGSDRVGDWMTREVLSVQPDATLGEVCDLMNRETVHRIFVTDGKGLVGVVAASDVVSYVAKSSSAWSGSDWS